MSFPNSKEIKRAKKKLRNVEPTRLLKKNASQVQQLKFALCKEFVVFIREHDYTQKDLAKLLEIDSARISEIVKYKIDLFTVDRLLSLLERLNPNLKITVA